MTTSTKKRRRLLGDDEEKKEVDTDSEDGKRRQRVAHCSIGEQRASRLKRRRGRKRRDYDGDGSSPSFVGGDNDCGEVDCHVHDLRHRNGGSRGKNVTTAVNEDHGNGEDNDGEDNGDEKDELSGYTTAYAAIRDKYPHHLEMMDQRRGDGMARSLNYQNLHAKQRNSKRARAIKLIQQRWRSQIKGNESSTHSASEKRHHGHGEQCNGRHTATVDRNNDTEKTKPKTIQPTLAYRKTHADYSSARKYQNMTFLNEQTILALDSYGDLDVVGLPLSMSQNTGSSANSGSIGVGTHLARLPLSPCMNNTDGPRCPLPTSCHLELFGYQNGEKFAVGLPSGQVQLFSSERMETHSNPSSRCTTQQYPGRAAVWSCLQPNVTTLGPQRRYVRHNTFSLSYMLSSSGFKNEALLESFNDYRTFQEIPNWMKHADSLSFSLKRTHLQEQFDDSHSTDDASLWAFREAAIGGGSSTALMGAFVDPELDCFSMRIIDERVGGGYIEGTNSDTASTSTPIFVDTTSHSSQKFSAARRTADEVIGVCFSGEYGLVTNHVINQTDNLDREHFIKFWDHRMLRSQPVSTASLVFPMDGLCGVTPSSEYSLHRRDQKCKGKCKNAFSCFCRPICLKPPDHDGHSSLGSSQERYTPLQATKMRLLGSSDSSDRFAIALHQAVSLDEVIIVDSSRIQIVQREIINPGPFSDVDCFSNKLDFLACHSKDENDKDSISIFDISRHKSCYADSIHGAYGIGGIFEGKKVQGDNPLSSAEGIEAEGNSFLGRVTPTFTDMYGIESSMSCMAMDEFGCRIACGTYDGDIFIVQGQGSLVW